MSNPKGPQATHYLHPHSQPWRVVRHPPSVDHCYSLYDCNGSEIVQFHVDCVTESHSYLQTVLEYMVAAMGNPNGYTQDGATGYCHSFEVPVEFV